MSDFEKFQAGLGAQWGRKLATIEGYQLFQSEDVYRLYIQEIHAFFKEANKLLKMEPFEILGIDLSEKNEWATKVNVQYRLFGENAEFKTRYHFADRNVHDNPRDNFTAIAVNQFLKAFSAKCAAFRVGMGLQGVPYQEVIKHTKGILSKRILIRAEWYDQIVLEVQEKVVQEMREVHDKLLSKHSKEEALAVIEGAIVYKGISREELDAVFAQAAVRAIHDRT